MSKSNDWFPNSRKDQLSMGKNWLVIFNEDTEDDHGASVRKYAAWGIPPFALTELGKCVGEAQSCLQAAENEETRTKPVNAACAAAFTRLGKVMRDIKKRYFFMPPLTVGDITALGVKMPDKTPSVSGTPTAQVAADIYLTTGRHELGVRGISRERQRTRRTRATPTGTKPLRREKRRPLPRRNLPSRFIPSGKKT